MDIITWSVIALSSIGVAYGSGLYCAMRFQRSRRLKYRLLKYKHLGGVPMSNRERAWYRANPDADKLLKIQLMNRIRWTKNWFVRKYDEFVKEIKRIELPKRTLTKTEIERAFKKGEDYVIEDQCDRGPKFRNLACDLREPDGISQSLTEKEFFGEPIKTKSVVKKGVEYLVLDEIDGEPVPVVRRETGDLDSDHASKVWYTEPEHAQ